MQIALGSADALIVVDMQKDFMPGGPLAVTGGNDLVPVINQLTPRFATRVFSRDWHPPDHMSFAARPEFKEFSWPAHAVQNTPGAEFHQDLNLTPADLVVNKAFLPDRESYSAFEDSDLTGWLQTRGVQRVFVCGVATDYCVKATALEAVKAGFQTFVILDAVRAVHAAEGSNAAVAAMRSQGVEIIFSNQLVG